MGKVIRGTGLRGRSAVSTLSRLNRTHPDKDDTFVLDFVNTADEIEAAFEPYYETTVATETDPNLLFDARAEVRRFGVVRDDEVDAFAHVYFASLRNDTTAPGSSCQSPITFCFECLGKWR